MTKDYIFKNSVSLLVAGYIFEEGELREVVSLLREVANSFEEEINRQEEK